MSNEIENSMRDQENEALKAELSKISEREKSLQENTRSLNDAISNFNASVDALSLKKEKDKHWSKRKKQFIAITYLAVFLVGNYLGVAGFISGVLSNLDLKPGNNVQVNGVCRTRDGGNVTLAGDQLRVTSIQSGIVNGVIIGDKLIYVNCVQKETRFEPYSVAGLFFNSVIKNSSTSSVREVETDPVYLLNKKSILATGICTRDTKKRVIYSGRVLEVLSVIEIAKEDYRIIAVESSTRKQVECKSSELKPTILDEELAKTLVQKELSSGLPLEATTLIGRDVLITGTCMLENYDLKKGKKPLLEFSKQLATVTSEDRENNAVVRITATANEIPVDEERTKLETVTIICDKKTFSNVFIEEYKKPN